MKRLVILLMGLAVLVMSAGNVYAYAEAGSVTLMYFPYFVSATEGVTLTATDDTAYVSATLDENKDDGVWGTQSNVGWSNAYPVSTSLGSQVELFCIGYAGSDVYTDTSENIIASIATAYADGVTRTHPETKGQSNIRQYYSVEGTGTVTFGADYMWEQYLGVSLPGEWAYSYSAAYLGMSILNIPSEVYNQNPSLYDAKVEDLKYNYLFSQGVVEDFEEKVSDSLELSFDVQDGWTFYVYGYAGSTAQVYSPLQETPGEPVVPEPASMSLLGIGLVGLLAKRRRS